MLKRHIFFHTMKLGLNADWELCVSVLISNYLGCFGQRMLINSMIQNQWFLPKGGDSSKEILAGSCFLHTKIQPGPIKLHYSRTNTAQRKPHKTPFISEYKLTVILPSKIGHASVSAVSISVGLWQMRESGLAYRYIWLSCYHHFMEGYIFWLMTRLSINLKQL